MRVYFPWSAKNADGVYEPTTMGGKIIEWLVVPDEDGQYNRTFYNVCAVVLTTEGQFVVVRVENLKYNP